MVEAGSEVARRDREAAVLVARGEVGVREVVFVAAAGSLDPGLAATVAVVARLAFVVVDAIGAGRGSLALRGCAQPERIEEP